MDRNLETLIALKDQFLAISRSQIRATRLAASPFASSRRVLETGDDLDQDDVNYFTEMEANAALLHFKKAICVSELWNASALAKNKTSIYELGFLHEIIIPLARSSDDRERRAGLAILQNICESRFVHGERNPNLVKLVADGVLDVLCEAITRSNRVGEHREDPFVRYMACMAIANLSLNEGNWSEMHRTNALHHLVDFVDSFDETLRSHARLFENWLHLQSLIPLLESVFPQVQLFALFCLIHMWSSGKYKAQIFHDLALNSGVKPLWKLATMRIPTDEHNNNNNNSEASSSSSILARVVALAKNLITFMDIDHTFSDVEPATNVFDKPYSIDEELATSAFDNPRYSDITFEIEGRRLHAHKVILAARSPQFAAMFEHGMLEANQRIIRIGSDAPAASAAGSTTTATATATTGTGSNISYEAFRAMLYWIYSGSVMGVTRAQDGTISTATASAASPPMTPSLAVEVLACANMYTMEKLKAEMERYLHDYIDPSNVCALLQAAEMHQAPQLARACREFALRNMPRVETTDGWLQLDEETKAALAQEAQQRRRRRLEDHAFKLEMRQQPAAYHEINEMEEDTFMTGSTNNEEEEEDNIGDEDDEDDPYADFINI